MPLRSSIVCTVILAIMLAASPALAQHGLREPRPTAPGQPSEWVKLLITAISQDYQIENWQAKDVMRARIEIDSAPACKEEVGDDEKSKPAVRVGGEIVFDVPGRRLRFDDDGGLTFLVDRDGPVAIWRRRGNIESPLTRGDVPDKPLHTARVLANLIALPLRMHDPDVLFGPGSRTELMDERLFTSMIVLFYSEQNEDEEKKKDEDMVAAGSRYPADWYSFFTPRHEPHWLRYVAYLVHDRSKPMTEFPRPGAVKFDDYEVVDNVPVPRRWTFWNFSRVDGIVGDPIAYGSLSEVKFELRSEGMFDVPDGALRVR